MAEKVGSVESEFGSVTSSQISFLKNCPFADPHGGVEKDTDSNTTEVLVTPISHRTPILSLSTPISLDSINDEDVFRTPPENASLSSAAESEPRATASQIKPSRGGSKSKSPSVSAASASLAVQNVRVSETNCIVSDPEEPVTDATPLTSPPFFAAAGNAKALPGGGGSNSKSKSKSPSPVSASQPLTAETARVLVMDRVSDPKESVTEMSPLAASNVRVPEKHSDLDSSPPSATEGIKVTESGGDDYEIKIPFKEVIEALLRNSGESLDERDERVSYVDILKQCGLKFP